MFGDQTPIIQSETTPKNIEEYSGKPSNSKKIIIFIFIGIFLVVLGVAAFLVVKKISVKQGTVKEEKISEVNPVISIDTQPVSTTTQITTSTLPTNLSNTAISISSSPFLSIAAEYLSFFSFYTAPDNNIETKFNDYELPLNVKIDVLNYYDLSRKLNLDPGLDSLSNEGFAVINNPWPKESPDFYSIYASLEKKQIPSLITSDFILYYYQTILKQVYKDIEENIFYNNLWSINKDLYNSAKNRYEARLALIGDINDSILEGERLEVAFFAVSLELLKPSINQIAKKDAPLNNNKFSFSDSSRYYFVTPPYLKEDVERELKLIREAREKIKSPVMLYNRDYKEFYVPIEYRENAKLNNFYLTKKWLNSVFPLNYRDNNCPNCLLDKEDWRLSMIAASFISVDFSDLPDLKNKWARIYKVMSFFSPLRIDLDYVYYRDTLKTVFGEKYNIEELFDDKNPDAKKNLAKFQAKLNEANFSPILGGIDKIDQNVNYRRGLKMLAENYSPNDYIFNNLSYPKVDAYLASSTKTGIGNITACEFKSALRRCNGMALDIINLIQPINDNSKFSENINYANYSKESDSLRIVMKKDLIWQNINYWSNLSILSSYLSIPKNTLPLFTRSTAWYNQNLNTAASSWIDMQLPVDKFKVNTPVASQSLNNFAKYRDNAYVEPNLNLINELISSSKMIRKMLNALQVDKEVNSVKVGLESLDKNLLDLRGIIVKELSNEPFNNLDNETISNFTKQLTIESPLNSQKQLIINFPNTKKNLKEDLSTLKLMVLVHQDGDDRVLSVGPVWSYVESR